MKEIKMNWKKWVFWFILGIAIITFYKILDNIDSISEAFSNFFGVISPFLIGILIAYLLYIPSRKIESWLRKVKIKFISNKARVISVISVYIIAIALIILIMNFILPVLIQSLTELVTNIQWYVELTIQKYNNLPDDSILKSQTVSDIIQNIQNIDIKQYINLDKIGEYAKGAINFVSSVANVFVAFIVSVYILIGRSEILQFFRKLVKAICGEKAFKNVEKYFNDTNEIFFGFISSQLIDAVIIGVLTTVTMSIMEIKYAPLLGFIIGLFNIIPYVGAIIAVIIAIIITIITGGLSQAIWMAVVVIILQQIDANIINPKIVGNTLKINPLLVMFAITVGGAYFGMIGLFLAVPISAVLKIIVEDYIKYRENSSKKM